MAEQYQNQKTLDRGAVYDTVKRDPNVVYNIRNQGQGLTQLVNTLDKFVGEISHQLDQKTVRKAQLAGSIAGLAPEFKEAQGDSLAVQAYNKAGTEIFVNRKLSQVSTSINKISSDPKYRNDPVRLQHALEDARADYLKDVPTSALGDFVVAYDDRMSRALQTAEKNRIQMVISANAGQFAETETVLLAEITNAAREGDEETIAQARTEYFMALDRQSGLSLMPEEITKKKIALQRQIQKDAVIGEFIRTPADKRSAFASSFIQNNPLADMLTAEEIDDLKREMITAWKVDDDLKDAAKKETEDANKKAAEDALAIFHLEPTPANYATYIGMPGVEPADIKAARSFLKQNLEEADPVVEYQIQEAIYTGRYEDARQMLNDPQYYSALPRPVAAKFRTKLAEVQAGAGFETTEPYKEVVRRINDDFGANSIYGRVNTSTAAALKQQIFDELQTKWPKYVAGELSYEDVDPIRMYHLKKSNLQKTQVGGGDIGAEIQTSTQGTVVIPKKYIDNPKLFEEDAKRGLGPGLSTPEVQQYMVEKRIEQLKALKTKGEQ